MGTVQLEKGADTQQPRKKILLIEVLYFCPTVGVEMGDWQEVWDENTGCYYYWNTQTNEVAWVLPQCLATQVQGLQHYQR